MGRSCLARVTLALFLLVYLVVTSASGDTAADSAVVAQAAPILSPWACTSPAIDGSAPFHEWGAAPWLATSHGRIYFMNDRTYMYFLMDAVGDTVDDPPSSPPNWGDYFWLTFDANLDGLITPNVDLNYSLYPSLPYAIGQQKYLGPHTWTGLAPTAASLGTAMAGSFASPQPHRVWEMAIPLSEIGAGPGSVVLTGLRLYSQNPPFTDDLPPDFYNDFAALIPIELAESGCQVTMAKHVNAAVTDPGGVLNYRIEYYLPGGTFADLTIYDALPPGLTFLPGSANPPATFSGGVLSWSLGDVSASGAVTFQAMVDHDACRRQISEIVDVASLTAAAPPLHQFSPPTTTEITCRPVEFPTDDPPYAESEITVNPYPLVAGEPTMLCTTIANSGVQSQTVEVEFSLASFGIGLPFTPLAAAGNPRLVTIPPGGSVTVCIQWTPVTPGHQCVQVTASDAEGRWPAIRSQRNLDVNEVLVPGEPSTFQIPVGNTTTQPMDVQMVVRNTCPGWNVVVNPTTFLLAPAEVRVVAVQVTPPAGGVLGSGCTLDIEAWVVDQSGELVRLIGGIRKVDEPLIPLGPPGERPFAEKEIRVSPYPLVSGEKAEVCVVLQNDTDAGQQVTVEFMMSAFGIGLAFDRIATTGGPNPQTVVLPAHSTVTVCVQFLPGATGHHCLAVKLSMPNGYVTYSRRNLDVAELLEPGVPEEVPISVGNPTAGVADIDLVVDNTCPGWGASVSPPVLTGVGPNSSDIRSVVLTVTPPAGLLGSNCHIDLLAYIDGRLIGGVRKIDRPPTAPSIDEPPWAEREITVSPDPPTLGQPAQVCVQLVNPTSADHVVDLTFAAADFGAGVGFTNFRTVADSTIPEYGTLAVCVPWTPATTGTLHRCLRIQIHQDGYQDVFSQRNVDLVYLLLRQLEYHGGVLDLPPFLVRNPGAVRSLFLFDLVPMGVAGMRFSIMAVPTGGGITAAAAGEVWLEPGEERSFFVRVEADEQPKLVGDQHYLDVLPYSDGQALLVDGIQSGVRHLFATEYPQTTVSFQADAVSAAESAGTIQLSVRLNQPAIVPVTVGYAVSGGTAGGGSDYTLAAGTLTFTAGQISKGMAVGIIDDSLPEPNETVVVSLRQPTDAILGSTASTTLTIVDNDQPIPPPWTYLPFVH